MNAPIYEKLLSFARKNKISFHMPGHKNGRGLAHFSQTPFSFDVTELKGTDNLRCPEEMIKQSQDLVAKTYGAKQSFYLVNGATCGILSMIYACVGEGERVIVDRACHVSVINALKLTKAKAVFVAPDTDKDFDLPVGVNADRVDEAFKKYNDIKAVIITSPTYYGRVSDVKKIAEIAHKNKALLLVDEAHGAHFAFSSIFPETAVGLGADVAVASMHKTMPCPNQGAILNIGTDNVDALKIKDAINMFQTSSPSYVLLAAMDCARCKMEDEKDEIEKFAKDLDKIKSESNLKFMKTDDPFRLVIDTKSLGMSGFDVNELLIDKYNIYIETATNNAIVLIVNHYNTIEEVKMLFDILENIKEGREISGTQMSFGVQEICEWDFGNNLETETVEFTKSAGYVSAQNITSYPPCIPLITVGEEICEDKINEIINLEKTGAFIEGIENAMVKVFKKGC